MPCGTFLGANCTFARTVHNGAERRINIFLRHFIMARVLDGVSGSAVSGSASERRVEASNPQPYRVGFEKFHATHLDEDSFIEELM